VASEKNAASIQSLGSSFQSTLNLKVYVKKWGVTLISKKTAHNSVFAIAGLDVGAIGSKSLLSFSSGLTLIIKLQILSSTKYFQ